MMQSGQDSCGDDGAPSNHQRIFAKKSEIKMDGILGTRRRMLIDMRFSSFADVGNNRTATNLAVTLAEATKQRQKSTEPVS
jgi:hypothetical protein